MSGAATSAPSGATAPASSSSSASSLDVREVGRTIREELLNNDDVQHIFEKHRGDTAATLRELEERGLVGTLYSTIQRAISEQEGRGTMSGRAAPLTEQKGGSSASNAPAARGPTSSTSGAAMNFTGKAKPPADGVQSAFAFDPSARQKPGDDPQLPNDARKSLLRQLKRAHLKNDSTTKKPILAVHLKRGKAFLDHLTPEEFAGCHLCVHFSCGTHDRKCVQPVFINGPDPVWNQVLQWELGDDEELERRNLESFHITVFRHWGDQRTEMVASQELLLREGNFVYELHGVEKKHKLVQGLVEIETQYLGGDWPLRPRVKADGAIEDPCGVQQRNDRLRKCFTDLDLFGENIHRHFRKRIDFYAETENGETYPLCYFVRRLDCARCLETPLHALRFASLFPSKRDVLFEKRDHICWHSVEHICAQQEASSVEKCLLLCGMFLQAWHIEAYVCLGTRSSPLAQGSRLAALAGLETGEQEQCCFVLTRGAEDEWTIWDPLRAERYLATDAGSKISGVEVAFNDTSIYVNPNEAYPTFTRGSGKGASKEETLALAMQTQTTTEGAESEAVEKKKTSKSGSAGKTPAPTSSATKAADSKTTGTSPLVSLPERRKRMAAFFGVKTSWVEWRSPLPKKPFLALKWGDRYFSSWNAVDDTLLDDGSCAQLMQLEQNNGASAQESNENAGQRSIPPSPNLVTEIAAAAERKKDSPEDLELADAHHGSKTTTSSKDTDAGAMVRSKKTRLTLPALASIPAALQRSTVGSGNLHNQQSFVEARIEDVLRLQFENACGKKVKWNTELEPLLGLALYNCERERVQLQAKAAVEVFEDLAKQNFCQHEKEQMVAFPIQFNDLRYERFFSVMVENSTVQTMVTSTSSMSKAKSDKTAFAVRCRTFLYPENVLACWVILAQKSVA